jgi:carboxylesterase type B
MFEIGGQGAYDGSRFASDGVVCVVINWRVGADGFLYLGGGDRDANLGLLDQVASLEWVAENIAAFGGDPGNVTVFGESAGAMSIGALLSMPRTGGLFRRAITQSGAAHHVLPAQTAARIGGYLAQKLGVAPAREAVAAVPVERLLAAQAELKAELLAHPDPGRWSAEVVASVMPFQPVIDGEVIPAAPAERIAAGASSQVDLIGTNTDDWRLPRVISGEIDQITDQILTGPLASTGTGRWPPTGSQPTRRWPPTGPGIPARVLGTCSRRCKQTGGCVFPPSAWPTPTPAPLRAPTCTSSPGPHRRSAGASAPSTRWRSPSSSTP